MKGLIDTGLQLPTPDWEIPGEGGVWKEEGLRRLLRSSMKVSQLNKICLLRITHHLSEQVGSNPWKSKSY